MRWKGFQVSGIRFWVNRSLNYPIKGVMIFITILVDDCLEYDASDI
ncbi:MULTISPECIES: hypothetical protein [Aquimarina]|nr:MULTISPECIES: hypothetical protein [Aquimarina]